MKIDRVSVHFETKVPGRHDYSNITVGAGVEATITAGENHIAAMQELHDDLVRMVREQVIERLGGRPASERTGNEEAQVAETLTLSSSSE